MGRFDELFALQAQRLAAHNTRHIEPRNHADGGKNQQDIATKEGHQQDHEEHKREGVKDFQNTHHHRVCFAAEIASNRAIERPDNHRDQRRSHAYHQRDPATDSHTYQQVTTRRIGAEPVTRGGIGRRGHHGPVGIVVGELRQHRRKDHEQRDQEQHQQADGGSAVMNKTTTRVLPETTPFYFQLLTERIKSFAVFLT